MVLIFAAVLLVAGGAGFYFFKIYRPAQDLKNAQQEVTGWEARWGLARDCLLGKAPGSAKTSEALAIHEMSPDPWDRGHCTPLISKLTRGEADDTGIPAIERAWNDLDKAAQKAAAAFATHVGSSTTIINDPLPAALDALDAARADLRKSAKLPPTTQAGGALVSAQVLPLMDGNEPVTSLEVDAIPSAHGLVLFGRTDSRNVQVTLTTGSATKIDRLGPTSLRAVPDTSWGTSPAPDIRIGAFDAEGAMPSVLATLKANVASAAIGSLKQGTVVAGNGTELYFARVKDNAVTVDSPIKISWAEAAIDTDGRAVVTWETADHKNQSRIIVATADGPTVDLPAALSDACLTKGIAWAQAGGDAYAFGGMAPAYRTDADGKLLQGCTADAALFRSIDEPEAVTLCTNECRKAKLPGGAPAASTVTVVDGNIVAISSHNGVLGMWREGAPPAFFALGDEARTLYAHDLPLMAMTDGKVIDILAQRAKSYVLVRLPAH